jgi:hypothetical protein
VCGGVVSLDGKTLRRSFDTEKGMMPWDAKKILQASFEKSRLITY